MTTILGIETSCDETAAAVVVDGRELRSNIIASQIDLHAKYGGVYPEVASRAHVEAINPVVQEALDTAGVTRDEIDAVAVTRGPGLVGALLVGLNFAKGWAMAANKPLLGINHLEGHVYSLWLTEPEHEIKFPVVVLIVSGGHTELLLMRGHGQYERLGGTLDDAAGEAFDKVGRMLGLPFPGGPNIDKAAREGKADAFDFPRAKMDESYDFSFSGLKTAVMRAATIQPGKDETRKRGEYRVRTDIKVADVAASFQRALVDVLVEKTVRAAEAFGASEILIAGGVSANQALRSAFAGRSDIPVRVPPLSLCTDNGAMIAAAGYYRFEAGLRDDMALDARPMWALTRDAYDRA